MLRRAVFALKLLIAAAAVLRAEPAPEGLEFYEKKIRPLLAENCYACHGPAKQKANLRLDSSAAILKGGDRGPALVPGDPDKSHVIQAVRYTDQELRMPPRSKLSDGLVADLTAWVKRGAPLPKDQGAAAQPLKTFDLAERRQHWCYQPVRLQIPPTVKDSAWCANAVDPFILARLENAGLLPAPPADRRTLVRRVTFDLIGLPPTPGEVETFTADTASDAYERLVERLLASPHYGERWGRHWLDLMRYAETLGHEFDYDILNAWRYRDYVVRAFNEDVPYDQFVIEHLAGDLLPAPRRHPSSGLNESVLGTACFWLGEEAHSPVDVRQQQANRMDNQLDVLGKAFLAQTLACARCHDHKFDAISTKDYYALAGYLKSSRYQQAFLDPPERVGAKAAQLRKLKGRMRNLVAAAAEKEIADVPRYLSAAREVIVSPKAAGAGLDAELLQRWVKLLQVKQRPASDPLFLWTALCEAKRPDFESAWKAATQRLQAAAEETEQVRKRSALLADLADPATAWFIHGEAFGRGPIRTGEFTVAPTTATRPLAFLASNTLHSGVLSRRLEGVVQSPSFTIDEPYLMIRTAGQQGRLNVVVDGLTIIRDPIYGPLTLEVNNPDLTWKVLDVSMWRGRRAYLELVDSTTPNPTQIVTPAAAAGEPGSAFVAVREVRLTSQPTPPPLPPSSLSLHLVKDRSIKSFADVAGRTQAALAEAIDLWRRGEQANGVELLAALIEAGLLGRGAEESIARLAAEYRSIEATIPAPVRAPALADGTGEDEAVFLRGNYKTPGERAPRRLPEAIAGADQPPPARGSGRLELARRLADPANPLTARVLVNRLWHHHFGAGLVRSVDDFGRMGELPTHPELLDYLAGELVRRQWSMKDIHRLLVLCSTYRMASEGHAAAEQADPQNRLLHRMPLRRLEAEAIRDAILSVSGRLDRRLGGPSVPPHLTAYMEGRGRPTASGPLDGHGRRSLYLNVRRNFLNPMFLAYDYPIPFTTVGRRTVSNVPAQALSLMNDPLVTQQAQLWAKRVLVETEQTVEDRIRNLYLTAFGRPPTEEELAVAQEFLAEQGRRYGSAGNDEPAWADLCHVLLNVKEFVFVK